MAVGFPSTRSRSHRLPGLYPPADGPGRGFAPQARRRATMMWEKGNATYTRHLATLDGSVIVRVACACVACRLALVVHRELWSRVKLLRVRWMARQLFGVQEVGIGIAVVGLGRCNWFGLVRRRTSSRVRAGAQNSTRLLECDGPWAMDVRALLVLLRIAMEKRWTRFVAKKSVLPSLSREPPTSAGAGEGTGTGGCGVSIQSVIEMEHPKVLAQAHKLSGGCLGILIRALWLQQKDGFNIAQVMNLLACSGSG